MTILERRFFGDFRFFPKKGRFSTMRRATPDNAYRHLICYKSQVFALRFACLIVCVGVIKKEDSPSDYPLFIFAFYFSFFTGAFGSPAFFNPATSSFNSLIAPTASTATWPFFKLWIRASLSTIVSFSFLISI